MAQAMFRLENKLSTPLAARYSLALGVTQDRARNLLGILQQGMVSMVYIGIIMVIIMVYEAHWDHWDVHCCMLKKMPSRNFITTRDPINHHGAIPVAEAHFVMGDPLDRWLVRENPSRNE